MVDIDPMLLIKANQAGQEQEFRYGIDAQKYRAQAQANADQEQEFRYGSDAQKYRAQAQANADQEQEFRYGIDAQKYRAQTQANADAEQEFRYGSDAQKYRAQTQANANAEQEFRYGNVAQTREQLKAYQAYKDEIMYGEFERVAKAKKFEEEIEENGLKIQKLQDPDNRANILNIQKQLLSNRVLEGINRSNEIALESKAKQAEDLKKAAEHEGQALLIEKKLKEEKDREAFLNKLYNIESIPKGNEYGSALSTFSEADINSSPEVFIKAVEDVLPNITDEATKKTLAGKYNYAKFKFYDSSINKTLENFKGGWRNKSLKGQIEQAKVNRDLPEEKRLREEEKIQQKAYDDINAILGETELSIDELKDKGKVYIKDNNVVFSGSNNKVKIVPFSTFSKVFGSSFFIDRNTGEKGKEETNGLSTANDSDVLGLNGASEQATNFLSSISNQMGEGKEIDINYSNVFFKKANELMKNFDRSLRIKAKNNKNLNSEYPKLKKELLPFLFEEFKGSLGKGSGSEFFLERNEDEILDMFSNLLDGNYQEAIKGASILTTSPTPTSIPTPTPTPNNNIGVKGSASSRAGQVQDIMNRFKK